jgi:hypothetical protein
MSFFDDFRRGVRQGYAAGAGRPASAAAPEFDLEQPGYFELDEPSAAGAVGGGDELAECKAVLAGYVQAVEQWQAAVAERDELIRALAAERDRASAARDRYQDNGRRALAQLRELESILAFPGAKTALLKALHPDTGAGGDVAARTAAFQTLMAALARLGIR